MTCINVRSVGVHLLLWPLGLLAVAYPVCVWAQEAGNSQDIVQTVTKGLQAREQAVTRLTGTAVVRTYKTDWSFKSFDLAIHKFSKGKEPVRSDEAIKKLPHRGMAVVEFTLGQDTSQVIVQGLCGAGNRWFSALQENPKSPADLVAVMASDGHNRFYFSRFEGDPRVTVSPKIGNTPEFIQSPYGEWLGLAAGYLPLSKLVSTILDGEGDTAPATTWGDNHRTLSMELASRVRGYPDTLRVVRLTVDVSRGCVPVRLDVLSRRISQPNVGSRQVITWSDVPARAAGSPCFAGRCTCENYQYAPGVPDPLTSIETTEFLDPPVECSAPPPHQPWYPLDALVVAGPHTALDDPALAKGEEQSRRLWGEAAMFKDEQPPQPDKTADKPIGQADLDALLVKYGLAAH